MKLRGSVTVFLSIILSVLIAFSGIMVDLSRLRAGEKHARAAVQLSVQSALTQYYAPLKENYGMMAMGHEQEKLEAMIADLLEKNLAVENRYMPGYTDLYGFEVENVSVTPLFNLSEDYVLEQQITQFMKYRAPVSTISNFVEKLKAMNTFMAQSGLIKKSMDLENKLQKIREEQVYLRLLLKERLTSFSSRGKPGPEFTDKFERVEKSLAGIKLAEASGSKLDISWKVIPEYTDKISEVHSQIIDLENDIETLNKECKPYQKEYDEVVDDIGSLEDRINELEDKIQKLEEKINKEEKKEKPDESKILSMKAEITALNRSVSEYEQQLSSMQTKKRNISQRIEEFVRQISDKQTEVKAYQDSIVQEKAALKEEVDSCVTVLSEIRTMAESIHDDVVGVRSVIEKMLHYHQEALALISEIRSGCEQVQGLTSQINTEIAEQSQKSDSAFLTRMKADIQKLVLNADPTVLLAIQNDLEANLSIVQSMEAIARLSVEQTATVLVNLNQFIDKTKKIPEKCSPFSRETFGTSIEEPVKSITDQVNGSISNYKKPEYTIEPMINQKEKSGFLRWCNEVFGEENETDISKDKGQQKKLKQNLKKKDEEEREEERAFSGDDADLSAKQLEKLFRGLPSWRDDEGNYPNVVNSEYVPGAETEKTPLPETEEKKNMDIEQRFDNAFETNGNFWKIISQVLGGPSEALVQSMYVNEFVVSAFKNANMSSDTRSLLLYNNGPQDTFFEKAEAEYVLFGCKREKANANLAQTTIFGIRMGMNLLHVYMCNEKKATALTAATAIAGWTGFGVPVVKNLILVGWAVLESWCDVRDINAGKDVAIYKTKESWKLDLQSLFQGIADEFLKESSKWLKQTTGEIIKDADHALQSVVEDIVSSVVHEAFIPLEETITEFGDATDNIEPSVQGLQQPDEISTVEDLKDWVTKMAQQQFQALRNESVNWTKVKIEDCKKKITEKILEFLFKSPAYKSFVDQIKEGVNNIIDSAASQLGDAIHKLGDKIGDTGTKAQLVGTVVSFDYADYLRLLLFVVPKKIKLMRVADLMQLNMQKTLDNPDFILSNYHSYMIVEAEVSIRFIFVPQTMMGDDGGKIKIRWGYGY